MLLGAAKLKSSNEDKPEPKKRVPIRLSGKLFSDMASYHSPKEKSIWVEQAIEDLLDREIYKDADWQDIENEDTSAFLALIDLDETLVDPVSDIVLLSKETYDKLTSAVQKTAWLNADSSRSPRPAVIRAAIRQRILLGGKLFKDIF